MVVAATAVMLARAAGAQAAPPDTTRARNDSLFGTYTPLKGFRVANTEYGDVNFKLYAYLRYLNQLGLDEKYTDSFGVERDVRLRQDIQLQKVNLQFLGWFLDPRFRYFVYTWTSNTNQGLGAQVVVGGNPSTPCWYCVWGWHQRVAWSASDRGQLPALSIGRLTA